MTSTPNRSSAWAASSYGAGAPPKVEVINDISRDVWGLFRVVQEHFPYFVDFLRFRLASRAEFERLLDVDPTTLTDIQRAARSSSTRSQVQ